METAKTGLQVLTEAYTQISTWMGSMIGTITSNALFLLPIGIFAAGAVIGLCYRLIRG